MASLRKIPRRKVWIACFTGSDGRRYQRSTGSRDRKEAQRIADEFEDVAKRQMTSSQVRRVVYDLHERITGQELSDLTVRKWVERYLKARENEITDNTKRRYRTAAQHFLTYLGEEADSPIIHLTKNDVIAFRDHLASRLSRASANGNLKIIKTILLQARRDGVILETPARDVQTLKARKGENTAEREPFTRAEIARIVDAADGELKGIILVGYFTGLRLGDICLLDWGGVELDTGKISVVTRKTGRRQTLPIHKQLHDYFEARSGADKGRGYVFPETAARVNAADGRVATISNRFTKLLADLDFRPKQKHRSQGKGLKAKRSLSPYSFHSLRHSFTSHLKEADVSEAVAMELVGHDTVAMTRHYTHISEDVLRGAVNSLPDVGGSGGGDRIPERKGQTSTKKTTRKRPPTPTRKKL